MTARCPSDLALEQFLLSPESSAQRSHVDGCESCQGRLAEMRKQGEDFLRFVFPATVEKVEEAAERGSRFTFNLARWLAPIPALAAAAAILLLVNPAGPPDDYQGVKGGGSLGLAVFLQNGAAAAVARDGQHVPADAALRFKVRPSRPCRLWLVSVDAAGEVSRLYPTQGDGGEELVRTTEIPGGAVLDGKAGPERIIALCAPGPVPYSTVVGAIKSVASSGAEAVRTHRHFPGLPAGTNSDSVLLEKTP